MFGTAPANQSLFGAAPQQQQQGGGLFGNVGGSMGGLGGMLGGGGGCLVFVSIIRYDGNVRSTTSTKSRSHGIVVAVARRTIWTTSIRGIVSIKLTLKCWSVWRTLTTVTTTKQYDDLTSSIGSIWW